MLTSVYALIVVLLLFADGQDPRRLDRLEAAVDGAALPPGWNLRAVGGEPLAHTVVEDSDGTTSLLMVADSAAGQAWLELEEDLDPRTGTLSWEWSVADRPTGTSLRDPAADDSGARFFVVFGGGGLFGRPRVLFYTWGEDEPVGDTFLSHVNDRLGVVVVRNAVDREAGWYRERRDPAEDFRRAFGRDPDEIRAFGLMADTDQLGGRAEVRLRGIYWASRQPPGGPGPAPPD